jgi:outer membrane receptor protein involved in Fe transport
MKDDWSANYTVRFVDSVDEYEEYGNGTYRDTATIRGQQVRLVLDSDDIFYHSVSVTNKMPSTGITATLGVANLFDQEPPRVSSLGGVTREGNAAFYSMYDSYGRRVFLNLSYQF